MWKILPAQLQDLSKENRKDSASTMEPLTDEEDIDSTDTVQDKKKIYVPTCN